MERAKGLCIYHTAIPLGLRSDDNSTEQFTITVEIYRTFLVPKYVDIISADLSGIFPIGSWALHAS